MAQESRSELRQERSRRPESDALSGERLSPPILNFPDPELKEIARSLQSDLKAAAVAIALEDGDRMVCRARAGDAAPDVGTVVPADRGITAECIAAHRIVHCADTVLDPRVDRSFSEIGIRSILVAPVLRNKMIAGVIVAFFSSPDAYHEKSVWRLGEAARQVADTLPAPQPETAPSTKAEEPACDQPAAPDIETPPTVEVPESLPPDLATEERAQPGSELEQRSRSSRMPGRLAPMTAGIVIVAVALLLLVREGSVGTQAKPPGTPASSTPASAAPADRLGTEKTSAEAGDTAAEFALAHVYRDGAGVPADPVEAQKWLRRSAEGGYPDAQLELAGILEHDKSANPVETYTWYVIAWQAGKTEAEEAIRRLTPRLSTSQIAQVRYNVGKAYASGTALPHDAVSAYVWYALAEWGGDTKARDRLRELEQQLTPKQLEEAKSRAATWIRRHTSNNAGAPAPTE